MYWKASSAYRDGMVPRLAGGPLSEADFRLGYGLGLKDFGLGLGLNI